MVRNWLKRLKGLDAKYYILLFLIGLISLVTMVNGFNTGEYQGECYERSVVCHGIPVDGCLGFPSESIEVNEENECDSSEDIKERCNNVKQELCTDRGAPANWSEISYVRDLECSRWMEEYEFEVEECQ